MWNWIKEHPYLSGALALLLIVLFIVFRNRSKGSSQPAGVIQTGPSDTVSAMGIQANAALGAATLQAQTQVAGYNAAVNIKALDVAQNTTVAGYQRDVNLQYILSGQEVADTKTAAELQYGLASLGATPSASTLLGHPGGTSGPSTVVSSIPTDPTAALQPHIDAASASLNPTYFGSYGAEQTALQSNPALLPSAAGLTYDQYRAEIDAMLQNPAPGGFVNNAAVGSNSALIDAANNAYLTDPNSCHNVVCDSNGIPVASGAGGGTAPQGNTNVVSIDTGTRGYGASSVSSAPAAGPPDLSRYGSLGSPTPTASGTVTPPAPGRYA